MSDYLCFSASKMDSDTLLDKVHVELQGKYCLPEKRQLLGSGTFGTVFTGRCSSTHIDVAIKRIKPSGDGAMKSTLRELLILQHLSPANGEFAFAVPLLDAYASEHSVFLVTRKYDMTLDDAIRGGLFDAKKGITSTLFRVIRSLKYVHSANIAHRDVKPTNIFMVEETHELVLGDFGLAHLNAPKAQGLVPSLAQLGTLCDRLGIDVEPHQCTQPTPSECVGTLWYCPPEQLDMFGPCELTTAKDMWAVGCILFEMLTGEPLFPFGTPDKLLLAMIKTLGAPDTTAPDGFYNTEIGRAMFDARVFSKSRKELELWQRLDCQPDSDEPVIDLLTRLLEWDPRKRITAADALRHPFISHLANPDVFGDPLDPTFPSSRFTRLLTDFAFERLPRRALSFTLLRQLLQEQIASSYHPPPASPSSERSNSITSEPNSPEE